MLGSCTLEPMAVMIELQHYAISYALGESGHLASAMLLPQALIASAAVSA